MAVCYYATLRLITSYIFTVSDAYNHRYIKYSSCYKIWCKYLVPVWISETWPKNEIQSGNRCHLKLTSGCHFNVVKSVKVIIYKFSANWKIGPTWITYSVFLFFNTVSIRILGFCLSDILWFSHFRDLIFYKINLHAYVQNLVQKFGFLDQKNEI